MSTLKQASIEEITSGKLTREQGHIVVCMRHYPRYLKKELRDEYHHELAPDEKLFEEFQAMKKKLGGDHNAAFRLVRYEDRFRLSDEASAELRRLSELSQTKDVYLACMCGPGERCHRDLLLIYAQHCFGAPAAKPRFPYPAFERRIKCESPTSPSLP